MRTAAADEVSAPGARTRAIWAFTSQALSSIANFIPLFLVLHSATPTEVGAFGLAYTGYFFLLTVVRGFAMEPLSVRFAGSPGSVMRIAGREAVSLAVITATAIGAVIATVSLCIGGTISLTFVALGLALPALLLNDALRNVFYTAGQGKRACVNDAFFLGVEVVLIAIFASYLHRGPVVLMGLWAAAAAIAAILAMTQLRIVPGPRAAARWFTDHRDLGLPFAGDHAVARGAEQLAFVIIGAIGGLTTFGAVSACRSVFAPISTIQASVNAFALPEAARLVRDGRAKAWRALVLGVTGIMVLLMAGAGAALAIVPDSVGHALLTANWTPLQSVLFPTTVSLALNGAAFALWLGMRSMHYARATFLARASTGLVTIVAVTIGTKLGGAVGATFGLAIGSALLTAFFLYYLFGRKAQVLEPRRRDTAKAVLPWSPTRHLHRLARVGPSVSSRAQGGLSRRKHIDLRTSKRTFWLPVFLMLPVAIGATTHVITPLQAVVPDNTVTYLHVPTLVFPVLFLVATRYISFENRPRLTPGGQTVGLLALWFTIAMIWGMLHDENGLVSVAYWVQALLPISAFALATWVSARPKNVARGLIIGGLIPCVLALVFSLQGGFDAALGRFPQLNNILPLSIFVGTIFAVAFYRQVGMLANISLAFSAFLLPGLWSRSSLAFVILGCGVALTLSMRTVHQRWRAAARIGLAILCLVGAGGAYTIVQHGTIGERQTTASFSYASDRRTSIYSEAIQHTVQSPVIGDAFGTVGNIRLSAGVKATFSTLFPTENQYLDYAVRAGFLASLLLVGILVGTLIRSLRLTRNSDVDTAAFARGAAGVAAGVLLANNFHLFMVQGQSAVVIWFVLGYANRLVALQRDSPTSRESVSKLSAAAGSKQVIAGNRRRSHAI